jgi:outer membrane immunogenic protein
MNRIALTLLAGVAALGFASSTFAADLIVEAPEAPMVAASGSWDGPFIGGFIGYASGEETDDFSGDSISGWLLGVDAGVNFTLTEGIVAGVVGDIAWTNMEDEFSEVFIDWSGSIRGRVGFDGGAFMPYLTAGLAFGSGYAAPPDVSNTHFGWTAGAGVEFAATEDLSVNLEYRYTDLGPENYSGPDIGFAYHQVTAGLHWNF